MRDRVLVVAACFAALGSGPAFAQTYASVGGGAALLSDSDLEDAGLEGEAEFETGFSVNGALGYVWKRLGIGDLRTEIEVGYRVNDVDSISALGITVSAGDAEVSALSGMVNVALDFTIDMPVQPYVMAGLGAANITLESDDLGVDDDDTVFAYQAGAGVQMPVTDSIVLFGGYRYFATADPVFEGTEAEYSSHNLEGGLRLNF